MQIVKPSEHFPFCVGAAGGCDPCPTRHLDPPGESIGHITAVAAKRGNPVPGLGQMPKLRMKARLMFAIVLQAAACHIVSFIHLNKESYRVCSSRTVPLSTRIRWASQPVTGMSRLVTKRPVKTLELVALDRAALSGIPLRHPTVPTIPGSLDNTKPFTCRSGRPLQQLQQVRWLNGRASDYDLSQRVR